MLPMSFKIKLYQKAAQLPKSLPITEELPKPPPPINGSTAPAPVGDLHHIRAAALASQYASQKNYVCEHQKNNIYDPEPYLFIADLQHRWDLPVLRYHKIMVIQPYPFLVVITQLFS